MSERSERTMDTVVARPVGPIVAHPEGCANEGAVVGRGRRPRLRAGAGGDRREPLSPRPPAGGAAHRGRAGPVAHAGAGGVADARGRGPGGERAQPGRWCARSRPPRSRTSTACGSGWSPTRSSWPPSGAGETELGAHEAADAFRAARSVDVGSVDGAPAPRGQPGAPRRHPPRRPPPPADDDAGAHRRHPARVQGVPVLRRDRDRAFGHLPPPHRRGDAGGMPPNQASWPSTSPRGATPSSTPSPPTPHDDLTTANTAIPGGTT